MFRYRFWANFSACWAFLWTSSCSLFIRALVSLVNKDGLPFFECSLNKLRISSILTVVPFASAAYYVSIYSRALCLTELPSWSNG